LQLSNQLVTIRPVSGILPAVSSAPSSGRSRKTVTPARATRDAKRTEASILAAATAEFARHGLGGARVDRIAERARSNKRMLYYYFGSKDALFLAVLESAYAGIRRAEEGLDLLNTDPADGVRRLIEFTWRYFTDHPEFLALLNSENLHEARHLKRSQQIRGMNSPLIETLTVLLRRGQRSGDFRSRVDPLQLYISIAGLSYFFLSNSHTLSAVFGTDLFSAKQRKDRLEHMISLVLGFLSKPS
jgi:AcrR family transcriptional regulator